MLDDSGCRIKHGFEADSFGVGMEEVKNNVTVSNLDKWVEHGARWGGR